MTSDCADKGRQEEAVIEEMKPDDLDEVLAIEHESFPSAWSRESYLRELRNRNSCYFVARLEDHVIGYAGVWVIGTEAHISTLAVRSDWRRRGIGERLLWHLLAVARERGVNKVTLEVREANLAARQLYRKCGFEEQRLLPGYYGDTGEDGVAMERRVI